MKTKFDPVNPTVFDALADLLHEIWIDAFRTAIQLRDVSGDEYAALRKFCSLRFHELTEAEKEEPKERARKVLALLRALPIDPDAELDCDQIASAVYQADWRVLMPWIRLQWIKETDGYIEDLRRAHMKRTAGIRKKVTKTELRRRVYARVHSIDHAAIVEILARAFSDGGSRLQSAPLPAWFGHDEHKQTFVTQGDLVNSVLVYAGAGRVYRVHITRLQRHYLTELFNPRLQAPKKAGSLRGANLNTKARNEAKARESAHSRAKADAEAALDELLDNFNFDFDAT